MKNLFTFDKTLVAGDKFYLTDIISDADYNEWFSVSESPKIYILNKNRCGNGGTTGFINYAGANHKGMFVLAPNRSIVQSKEIQYKDICCIYGGNDPIEKRKPVKIATWDQGPKILDEYPNCGFDGEDVFDMQRWRNSLVVIDEYHKLVEDCSFREICAKTIELVLRTDLNVVLMSATPNYELVEYLKEHSKKEVITIDVKYDDEDKTQINYIDKGNNKIKDIINEVIRLNEGKQLCIFNNDVEGTDTIIHNSIYKDDMELLCSKDNEKSVNSYSESFDSNKHIHFLTSAYFTGMDIDIPIDYAIIIGGNLTHIKSYSASDIKQMLGRFRKGVENIFVIKENSKLRAQDVNNINGQLQMYSERFDNYKDQTKLTAIDDFLRMLHAQNKLDAIHGWESFETFKSMMNVYQELRIVKGSVGEAQTAKRRVSMTFAQFKENVLNGADPETLDFKYRKVCKRYIEVKGIEAFKNADSGEIKRYVKLIDVTDCDDIQTLDTMFATMKPDELFDIFLSNDIYTAQYLTDVLNFIGWKIEQELSIEVSNAFDCICFMLNENKRPERNTYLIIKRHPKYVLGGQNIFIPIKSVSSENVFSMSFSTLNVSVKTGYTPTHKTIAATKNLYDIDFASLQDIVGSTSIRRLKAEIEEKIADTDDPEIINDLKKEYKSEVKKKTTLISEFYNSNDTEYGHKTEYMDSIESIIIDIDDSIDYNTFAELYSSMEYIAYPSISNTNESNWNKFRVVFPLDRKMNIPNSSLSVLKAIRKGVCKYEDKQHNLGAYVAKEDWEKRIVNTGTRLHISTDLVAYLSGIVDSAKIMKSKIGKSGNLSNINLWTVEEAKSYWNAHDKDGEHHRATYVIKNHLSEEDRTTFIEYIQTSQPDYYKRFMQHWNSHK